jgi:GNAT superfamily N-acetyltransferase
MLDNSKFTTRLATTSDALTIAGQRRKMFADSGQSDDAHMQTMAANFVPWVEQRLANGTYLGWLVENDGQIIAGSGLWLIDFPPHFMDAEPVRAYLLNFYVDAAFRGHGLAYTLLNTAIAEAKSRGIKVVSLHASKFGKPLYERNGFTQTNEMILRIVD